ncbi:iron complex outermembrane recepter protein [Sphingopyxis sp. YR583]|uniref:TonB-dependent receptor n=1 Tax=Sphingopyxis sp. YR583 TaxID=1881047 RepID=UPI0008A804C6|nr:TonB-dependent receptor [Sphingopyxis sp. YR583]SEH13901.1 iron complex outermembrane recepter protein [Sphingopyxis sp. YR583]
MRNGKMRRLTCSALALLLAGVSAPALAQQTSETTAKPAAAETSDGTDIVVTAQKRSERLQDVPIAVSAIGGEALEKSRVMSADELAGRIVNLQLTSTVGDNTPIFALRGVSMSDYSLNQASPVATYYDEVYKGNFAFLGVAMYDLERVEVLRGPQGTLYGKNTTGGAVNLISRTPELGGTEGYLNLGYGNYDRYEANGALNVPLGETLAARVAFTFARADGWFKNQLPGEPDLASVREYGIRGSLLFEPSDSARFVLRASTSYQNPRNYGIYAQPEAVNRPGLSRRQIEANVTDRRRARTWSVSLTGSFDVSDTLAVTSVTSWDKGRLSFYEDTDGTASELLEIPYVDRATQFAQDLRLTSDFGGPFNFILGAYFNREKVYNQTTFEIGKDIDSDGLPGVTDGDCAVGFPLGCLFRNSFDQVKKSYALYSDMSFEATDALTLRGGIRFTHDKGVQSDFEANAFGPNEVLVMNLIPPSRLDYSTENLSGKIGADYKVNADVMLYGNYSRGYRAPSFNAQAFFDPSELSVAKAEKIDAFELGVKSQFADRRVTLNMAAFHYTYSNQQFINVDPATAAQTLLNIPRSRILGGEAELTVRASDMLTLRGGLGLLDTKINRGTVSGVDVSGNRLSNAPKLTFSGGFDATVIDGGSGKLSLHGDLAYSSNQYFEVLNIPRLRQKSYLLLSGHIDWVSDDGRWTASLWGKNLANKFYFTSRVDLLAGFGFDYNHVGSPRTYGVTVGTKF